MSESKILIVEDEQQLADVLSRVVEKLGYRAIVAENGLVAEKILQKEQVKLILLDLLMPTKDGFEFLDDLRKNEKLSSMNVIVLTNYDIEHQKERLLALGVQDYIIKSNFELNQISDLIKKYL